MEGCCSVCTKRLNPNSTISEILSSFLDEYASVTISDEIDVENDENYCPLCLGTLYPKFVRRLMSLVQKNFLEEKYDVTDFNICISYPISCIIRERLVELYLQSETSETFPEITLLKLKDVCKVFYKALAEKALNMQSDHQSNFNVNINFTVNSF